MLRETARVLLVDDDKGVTEILDAFLSTAGYEVAVENESLAGIEKAKTFKPHIILLDISMPVMDGYDVCAALKKDVQTADIPVVLLTGRDTRVDQSRDSRSDGYLRVKKPFSCERLLDVVKIVLLSVSK